MGSRAGTADLPLHGGRVPAWLSGRMATLAGVMAEAIVHHYGRDEFLGRLANPFWFQSFGAVIGMDWHSSGVTTTVLSALRRGLAPRARELGVHVCGGRGRRSRRTPDELMAVGEATGLDGGALAATSRLVAKVDSAAVQDGFELYQHGFVVTDDGRWIVVQQGMDTGKRQARRYHWKSEGLAGFFDSPHSAVEGPGRGIIVNLADRRAAASRAAQLEILAEIGPDGIARELGRIDGPRPSPPPAQIQPPLPHLVMPARYEVRGADIVPRRLHGALAAAAERGPEDFAALLSTPGVGARTVFALAQVAEIVHGAPCRFSDPARFSLAHGGKDGHPYPVPLEVYDRTIAVMKAAVTKARLGRDEEADVLRRLDREARRLERTATGSNPEDFIEEERRASHRYGGRSVFGPAGAAAQPARGKGARRRNPPPPADIEMDDLFTRTPGGRGDRIP